MPTERDYYEILGVSRDAGKDEIKKAYRKLALQFHPDRNKEADAEDRFKEISEAYAVLSDQQKRRAYDTMGHAGFDQQYSDEDIFRGVDFGEFGFDLGDIIARFFGGGGGPFGFGGFGGRGEPGRGRDLRYDLAIPLEAAARGGEHRFTVERLEACATCHGSGADPGKGLATCGSCNGHGQVRRVARTPFGQMATIAACPSCRGRGQIPREPCKACAGRGRGPKSRTLTVRVPPGVPDGARLRVRGEGEAGEPGAPPGDLYVFVHVTPHEVFERHGNDLHVVVPLTVSQAVLGDHLDVPLIDGSRHHLHVPAGTQPGETFRLRGKGMPVLNSSARGDLIGHARVYVPTKLGPGERELYEQLAKLEGREKANFFEDLKRRIKG